MKKAMLLFFVLSLSGLNLFAQTTGDAWIKKVYNDTWGRDPAGIEWNINNYANGHWKDYTELMKAIYEWRKNMATAGVSFKYSEKTYNNSNIVVAIYQNGIQMGASIISTNGAGIVASGGGNIVASGGGNIVASGGGNIVASGGGNIVIRPDTRGFTIGSAYTTLASGGSKIKTSGTGAILIQ